MSHRLDCPSCRTPLDVTRLQRGREIPCPHCRATVAVPRELDFAGTLHEALRDRRTGHRALVLAFVATALCVAAPACAAIWWWSSRRISAAIDEGRVPAEPLLAARVVAAVGFFAQLAFWGRLLAAR